MILMFIFDNKEIVEIKLKILSTIIMLLTIPVLSGIKIMQVFVVFKVEDWIQLEPVDILINRLS